MTAQAKKFIPNPVWVFILTKMRWVDDMYGILVCWLKKRDIKFAEGIKKQIKELFQELGKIPWVKH